MKKLVAMAVALSIAPAFAAWVSGDNFETAGVGNVVGGGIQYWLGGDTPEAADDACRIVSTGDDTYSHQVGQPDHFAQSAQTKHVSVNTSLPLRRMVNPLTNDLGVEDGTGTNEHAFAVGYVDEDPNPLYIDTLVKFTQSDIAPEVQGEDKLVIWMEANGVLKVKARAFTGNTEASYENKTVTLSGTYEADKWYRLTVKVLPANFNSLEMLIYIDGTLQTYSAEEYVPFSEDMIAYYGELGIQLTEDETQYISQHALFVAMGEGELVNSTDITHIAFEGIGAVDDISFTTDDPAFLSAPVTLAFTLALGEGVTSVAYTVGATSGTASAETQLDVAPNGTVTITSITPADWYSTTPTLTQDGAAVAGSAFTVTAAGSTGVVSSASIVAPGNMAGSGIAASSLKAWAEAKNLSFSDVAGASADLVDAAYLLNTDLTVKPGIEVTAFERTTGGVKITLAKVVGENKETLDSAEIRGTIYYYETDDLGNWGDAKALAVSGDVDEVSIATTKKFFKFEVK